MSEKNHITIRTVENRKWLALQAVASVLAGYIFVSLAIDSGSYWHYLLTFIAIGLFINAFGRLAKDVLRQYTHGRKKH